MIKVRIVPIIIILMALFRAQAASAPNLVIIGGNLSQDGASVYEAMISQAGGRPHATLLVFGTNSGEPGSSITYNQQIFADYGVHTLRGTVNSASMVRMERVIFNLRENLGLKTVEQTLDYLEQHEDLPRELALIKKIKGSTGIYFGGGEQDRAKEMFYRPDGSETYVLSFMRRLINRGMLFAGTSAGAAMQSEIMITAGDSHKESLLRTQSEVQFEKGFGFIDGVIVDQHFGQRGRFARLLPALYRAQLDVGVGIDEGTALLVRKGRWEVRGEGHVYIFRLNKAGSIQGASLSLLSEGDIHYPKTGKTVFATKEKVKVATRDRKGFEVHPETLFESLALRGALQRLITSAAQGVSVLEHQIDRSDVDLEPRLTRIGHLYSSTSLLALGSALQRLITKDTKGMSALELPLDRSGIELRLTRKARLYTSTSTEKPMVSGEGIEIHFSKAVANNFPPRFSCRNVFRK